MTTSAATILNGVTSATGTSPSANSGVTMKTTTDTTTLANNFQTFLTLLTTQLKNQNPLEPLDTNQFTQQLVQFAGVEQQMKMNTQLGSLITIEQSARSEEHTSELQSPDHLVCPLLLEQKTTRILTRPVIDPGMEINVRLAIPYICRRTEEFPIGADRLLSFG